MRDVVPGLACARPPSRVAAAEVTGSLCTALGGGDTPRGGGGGVGYQAAGPASAHAHGGACACGQQRGAGAAQGAVREEANPGGWALQSGQNFSVNHAPATIDFAAIHVWPDNWERCPPPPPPPPAEGPFGI